ncbi:MAG TPA: porin family protein [Vicinamibacterales bacterium]|nr:porin family protein [Vicinamibacterales bacterium]
MTRRILNRWRSAALAVLLTFFASAARAQTVGAGVKAGIDFASLPNAGQVLDQIVGQPSAETSSNVGILFGGFVTWPIADGWSLQPELQFVTKGVKLTETGAGGTVTAHLNYLEFPLLARYQTTFDNRGVYVALGPTFGVKASTSAQGSGATLKSDIEIDPAIRSFDGGLAFAGGVVLQRVFVEFRYTQGLNDVATDLYAHTDSLRNRVLAVSVGVQLK